MNVKDLRIGNYVQSGTGIYEIIALSDERIEATKLLDCDTVVLAPHVIYKPIPLNDELFEKLGFDKIFNEELQENFWAIGQGELVFWVKGSEGFYYELDTNRRIRFLHELQNFVRIIIGIELTYKI